MQFCWWVCVFFSIAPPLYKICHDSILCKTSKFCCLHLVQCRMPFWIQSRMSFSTCTTLSYIVVLVPKYMYSREQCHSSPTLCAHVAEWVHIFGFARRNSSRPIVVNCARYGMACFSGTSRIFGSMWSCIPEDIFMHI